VPATDVPKFLFAATFCVNVLVAVMLMVPQLAPHWTFPLTVTLAVPLTVSKVPAVIVKSLVTVTVLVSGLHSPPEPLKVRLWKLPPDAAGLTVYPVVTPVSVTVEVLAVNVPADESQLPESLIREAPEQVTTPLAPMVMPAVLQPVAPAPMVTVPPVTVELPVTANVCVPTASVPAETVSAPASVIPALWVTIPVFPAT